MSYTSYPSTMSTKSVFNDLRKAAKKRPDFVLTESKASGNKLWLGGMLTTHNARFYFIFRHELNPTSSQVTVTTTSVDMGFEDTAIPSNILKKLRAEWYWRRNENVCRYIETVIRKRTRVSSQKASLEKLGVNDSIWYAGVKYKLKEDLGKEGWGIIDEATGQAYLLSNYRFSQCTPA